MTDLKQPCDSNNPIVFLHIRIGLENVGRVIIELRKDVVPKTAENFRCLCTGENGIGANGKPLHYKGIQFHTVQRLFMVQGGDIVKNDGSSGESIYGPLFDDENFTLQHKVGLESIKNAGNLFFSEKEFIEARRKYKKTVRYFNHLKDKLEETYRKQLKAHDLREKLQPVFKVNNISCLNIAAVELKLKNAENAKNACDEVLLNEPQNAKALYRRGQAHIDLKNYDDALVDLESAYRSMPNDKNIQNELQKAKEIWRNYQNQQMNVYKNLFERI